MTINISFVQIKWISQYASYITDYYKKYNKLKKSISPSSPSSPSSSSSSFGVPQLLSSPLLEETEKIQEQGWFSYLGSYIESFLPGDDTLPPSSSSSSTTIPNTTPKLSTPSLSPRVVPSHYETNLTIICVEVEKFTIILHEDKVDRIYIYIYIFVNSIKF